MRVSWRGAGGVFAALGLGFAAVPAGAEHICDPGVPVHFPTLPAADQAIWEVEGPITAYDAALRTFTVNGMTFHVPGGPTDLVIATADLEGPPNLTFDQLVDPVLEAQRSIVGGTVIASGVNDFALTPTGTCMTMRATAVYVDLGEHVIFGPLVEVLAPPDGAVALNLNGATVTLDTDPRWPARVIDGAGNEVPITALAELEGQGISAEGYFDPLAGVLFARLIEFEGFVPQEGNDTLGFTRVEADRDRLRIDGGVSVLPSTGTFVASVTIHAGTLEGGICTGPVLGLAPVDAVDGIFRLKLRNVASIPATVCGISPGGAAGEAVVNVRR